MDIEHGKCLLHDFLKQLICYLESLESIVPKKELSGILNKSIDELNLSVRAYNSLTRHLHSIKDLPYGTEIKIGDIAKLTKDDLMKVRNLGKKSAKEIEDKLREIGVELKD